MQVRTSLRSFVVSLLVLCAPATVAAGIPSPANSTVPIPIVACPAGDAVSRVIVRDIGNFPVSYCPVTIDLSACSGSGLVLCLVQLSAITDADGIADFRIKMGGTCPTGAVISASGITLWGPIPVASPDQNGDRHVSPADTVIANGLVGTQNEVADFDGDGLVTEGDVAWILDMHGGHTCDTIVPARKTTWGRVKILYR